MTKDEEIKNLNAKYQGALDSIREKTEMIIILKNKNNILKSSLKILRNYPDFDDDKNLFGKMIDQALEEKIPDTLIEIMLLIQGR